MAVAGVAATAVGVGAVVGAASVDAVAVEVAAVLAPATVERAVPLDAALPVLRGAGAALSTFAISVLGFGASAGTTAAVDVIGLSGGVNSWASSFARVTVIGRARGGSTLAFTVTA